MPVSLERELDRLWSDEEYLTQQENAAVKIKTLDLEDEMAKHAELHLHWARLSAMADQKVTEAKDNAHNFIWNEAMRRAALKIKEDGTKDTKDARSEYAYLDLKYRAANKLYEHWIYFAVRLKKVADIMYERSKMLQSINKRQGQDLDRFGADLDDLKERAAAMMAKKAEER